MTSTNLANALAARGDLEETIAIYRSVLDAARDAAQRSVARYNLALAERRLRERATADGMANRPSPSGRHPRSDTSP
jgi:hypothetical protein